MKSLGLLAIFTMGSSGLMAEILLLREFLIVFSGNEFSLGLILSNWLVIEALGCLFFAKKVQESFHALREFTILTILFSLSLLVAIFLVRLLKSIMGVSIGEHMSFFSMFYSSFLISLPISMFHGALFPLSCQIYTILFAAKEDAAGKVYAYETAGSVIGGTICTYLLIPYFNTFQVSTGLATWNLIACLFLVLSFWQNIPSKRTIFTILIVFILLFSFFTVHADKLHLCSLRIQWRHMNLLHYENSKYGNISVIENEGQYTFFQDGMPTLITPVPDISFVETFVHLPLFAHPKPQKIFILSGGVGGVINEVLKHPSVETIEYAELDPLFIDLLRKFSTSLTDSELKSEKVQINSIDGLLLLRLKKTKYDVIFVGIMAPSNLQTNRFFTREFFLLVKERLNREGMFIFNLPSSLTYSTQGLRDLNSCIFRTLKGVFPIIRVIPHGGYNIFLASQLEDTLIPTKKMLMERARERNMKVEGILPWYIEQKLHSRWQDLFHAFIEKGSHKINLDFYPIGVFYHISHWNTIFSPSLGLIFRYFEKVSLKCICLGFAIFLFLFMAIRYKIPYLHHTTIPLSIISTGFAGMIFHLVIVFAFQSIYGYIFSRIGLLVASFMAGTFCGAFLTARPLRWVKSDFSLLLKIEFAMASFSIMCPLGFFAIRKYLVAQDMVFFFEFIFLIISSMAGFLIGSEFPVAARIYFNREDAKLTKTAGILYACDLLGGWFAGMVGSFFFLPLLGLFGTCVAVSCLKLTSFMIICSDKEYRSKGVRK